MSEIQAEVRYVPSADIPYVCTDCGQGGKKLWRKAGNGDDKRRLQCALCACKQDNILGSVFNERGEHFDSKLKRRVNTIGRRVPAIPQTEGREFHWTHDTPEEAQLWWESLPTK